MLATQVVPRPVVLSFLGRRDSPVLGQPRLCGGQVRVVGHAVAVAVARIRGRAAACILRAGGLGAEVALIAHAVPVGIGRRGGVPRQVMPRLL